MDSFYGKTRPKINSLLSIWYGVLVGGLNVYLIVQSVKRFVWLAELSWPYQKTPFIELNAYIALSGVAVLLLPFFLTASFLKIGNVSNDNQSIGQDDLNKDQDRETFHTNGDDGAKGFFRTIWKHCGPIASLLHIISSFCLLLPQTIIEAVLAKYGHLPQDTIWRTDLDFMMSQKDRNVVLSIIGTTDLKSDGFEATSGTIMMDHTPGVISMEYLNYALALIVFSIRYPSVFWKSSKTFSLIFSAQLILNSLHSLFSYSCFTVLYKLHVVGPSEVLHKTPSFLLNNHVTLLLYIISAVILLLSSAVFYHYGFLRVVSFSKNKGKTSHIAGDGQSTRYGPGWAYFPHCSALAVLLSLAATQSPVVYDATLLYKISLDSCMITFVSSSAVHMLFWIIVWFWLTSKTNGDFQLQILPECADGKLKSISYKKSISELARSESTRGKRVMFYDSGADVEQQYFVSTSGMKSPALEITSQERQHKEWPGPCQDAERQQFLEPEDHCWVKSSNFNSEYTPVRNKVTFEDSIPSPRYGCTPVARPGGLKRTAEECPTTLFQDTGDYALLRNGPPRLQRTSSIMSKPEHVECQKVPASIATTDSGYSGADSTSRSDSRSTAGSRSPPYRPLDSSVTQSTPSASNVGSNPFEFNSEQHASDYSTYGKLGLVRRESVRSTIHPIYEETKRAKLQQSIYESRKIQQIPTMTESPYEAHHISNKNIPKEHFAIHVNDLVNPIYGFSKKSSDSPTIVTNNPIHPNELYGVNAAKKLQELEKTFLKTSDHNLQRDSSFKSPRRNNSFRQPRSGDMTPDPSTPLSPYVQCNNLKLGSFTEPKTPPIPPPLPPLSFLGCQRNGSLTPFSRPGSSDFGNGNNCYSPLSEALTPRM